MKYFIPLLTALLLLSCSPSDTDENATPIEMDMSNAAGYDDFSSPGAAFCVCVDENKNYTVIMAFEFTTPFYTGSFRPNGSVHYTISNYKWGLNNDITDSITNIYPFLSDFMTNTYGIQTMGNDFAAFFVMKIDSTKDNTADSLRIFAAYTGSITLTREDGPQDIAKGILTFREITGSGSNARIKDGGEIIKVDDIYTLWDTEDQP